MADKKHFFNRHTELRLVSASKTTNHDLDCLTLFEVSLQTEAVRISSYNMVTQNRLYKLKVSKW